MNTFLIHYYENHFSELKIKFEANILEVHEANIDSPSMNITSKPADPSLGLPVLCVLNLTTIHFLFA